MKILAREERNVESGRRFEATVVWEDSDRPSKILYFEAIGEGSERYRLSSDAMLLAAGLPAIEAGERRIALPGSLCPRLASGFESSAILFRKWFGSRASLSLEAAGGFSPPLPPRTPRAAAFFSGGIDSTFMVQRNRESFLAGHPAALRDLLFVSGLDHCGDGTGEPAQEVLDRTRVWIEPEVARRGAAFRVVATNARTLCRGDGFFDSRYQSACLAAAVHGWSGEISSASVGSGRNISNLIPRGTHPLIDRWWSSTALSIRHEYVGFTRWEKLEHLARAPDAVRHLIVCHEGQFGPFPNCGACSRCVGTLGALTALGIEENAESFPGPLTVEAINAVKIAPNLREPFADSLVFWEILSRRLLASGRRELANAVRRRLQ